MNCKSDGSPRKPKGVLRLPHGTVKQLVAEKYTKGYGMTKFAKEHNANYYAVKKWVYMFGLKGEAGEG